MKKLIAKGEAQKTLKQLTRACSDCPLRRDSLKGWLGGSTPRSMRDCAVPIRLLSAMFMPVADAQVWPSIVQIHANLRIQITNYQQIERRSSQTLWNLSAAP